MQKLTSENVVDMEYYTFKEIPFAGIDKVIFSTTGYTGSGGCEVYAYNKDAEKLWNAVFEAGAEFGIQPIGLGARDTLSLEAGSVSMGMKSTMIIRLSKPVWDGLLNSCPEMILSCGNTMKN